MRGGEGGDEISLYHVQPKAHAGMMFVTSLLV